MNESLLKKEFRKNDVQRVRNLVTGKGNDSTSVQSGYSKYDKRKKEGDIWEENGKTWTIRNGIKTSLGKLDTLRKQVVMPITCPSCSQPMKKNLDKKFWGMYNKCMDCVIEEQHKMKIDGTYREYEKKIIHENITNELDGFEDFIFEYINENLNTLTENGTLERWVGSIKNKDELRNVIKSDLEELRQKLKNNGPTN